jgi:hypothetical protein
MKQRPPVGHGHLIIEASRWQTQHIRQDFSARVISPSLRPLPENTQHSQETFVPPAGFESAMPASERPQTHALDRTTTWIGLHCVFITKIANYFWSKSVIKLIGILGNTSNKLGKVYYTSHEIIGFIRHYIQDILNNSGK